MSTVEMLIYTVTLELIIIIVCLIVVSRLSRDKKKLLKMNEESLSRISNYFEELKHYKGFYNAAIKLVQQIRKDHKDIQEITNTLIKKLESKLPKDDIQTHSTTD